MSQNNEDDLGEDEFNEPDSDPKNIMNGNLLEDSFFESDIVDVDADEGVSSEDFSTVSFDETPSEADDSADFKSPAEVQELLKNSKQEVFEDEDEDDGRITSQPLKTSPIPKAEKQKSEKDSPNVAKTKAKTNNNMNKKEERFSMATEEDDPTKQQYREFWDALSGDDGSDLKIMVYRLEPQTLKGVKISGYLEVFYMPTTVPDIIEQVGIKYGGGKYQLKVVDSTGKYIKSKIFEIAGFPKIPDTEKPEETTKPSNSKDQDEEEEDDSSEEEDIELDDSDDDDLDFRPNGGRPLQPVATPPWSNPGSVWGGNQQPPYGNNNPVWNNPGTFPSPNNTGVFGGGFREQPKEDVAEKVKKELKSELDNKIGGLQQTISSLVNNLNRKEDAKPIVTPELISAALPLFTAWFEKGSSKDNVLAQQFDQMNQRMVNLVESLRDMSRTSDKSKEEMIERERREREAARKEMQESQQRAEERLQALMQQMHSSLEKRFSSEVASESKLRQEFQAAQEEARRREEAAREEARRREEEARRREEAAREEARRREEEFKEKQRQEELRWREELRQREEEAKKAEIRWREELRQKELAAEREARQRELEMQNHLRQLEIEKFKTEQKMLEQIYNSKAGSNDQRLNLELALAKITGENDMKMLQAQSQMEFEKLKMQTQMTIEKMKNELEHTESKSASKDPLEEAIADHMKKKTYLMIVNQLKLENQEEQEQQETPMGNVLKTVINQGTNTLQDIFKQILGGGGAAPQAPPQGRVVTSNPSPPAKTGQNPPVRVGTPPPVEEKPAEAAEQNAEQGEMAVPNLEELQEQLGKIGQFFDYLKGAIERNEDPAVAADAAHEILPDQILEHLASVEDSSSIITDLEPFLSVYNPEYVGFFTQEPVRVWLNKVLENIRDSFEEVDEGSEAAEAAEAETPAQETPKPSDGDKKHG